MCQLLIISIKMAATDNKLEYEHVKVDLVTFSTSRECHNLPMRSMNGNHIVPSLTRGK
ncbi:unnamed protein product [Timema podura]|uniref:Uncharacterized protein n=1 Tax=Timema podura TaxID=61482 RepID=A0ABN7P862_TIMPD|nr:unnamed protein product [Timema podura]